jgi:hypothetical protein
MKEFQFERLTQHYLHASNKAFTRLAQNMRGNSATAFHHSVLSCPPLRTWKAKNLRGGKVLTSECQMWRGLPSSIAGKAANNHLYCLGVLISHTNPRSGLYVHEKLPHQAPVLFVRKTNTVLLCTWCSVQSWCHFKEMPVPIMSVSGSTFLLSLSPPSN